MRVEDERHPGRSQQQGGGGLSLLRLIAEGGHHPDLIVIGQEGGKLAGSEKPQVTLQGGVDLVGVAEPRAQHHRLGQVEVEGQVQLIALCIVGGNQGLAQDFADRQRLRIQAAVNGPKVSEPGVGRIGVLGGRAVLDQIFGRIHAKAVDVFVDQPVPGDRLHPGRNLRVPVVQVRHVFLELGEVVIAIRPRVPAVKASRFRVRPNVPVAKRRILLARRHKPLVLIGKSPCQVTPRGPV